MTSMHAKAAIAGLTLAAALAGAGSTAAKSPPSTVKCGDTLTRSVKLTADLTDWTAPEIVFDSATDLRSPAPDGFLSLTAPASGIHRFYRLKVTSDASR